MGFVFFGGLGFDKNYYMITVGFHLFIPVLSLVLGFSVLHIFGKRTLQKRYFFSSIMFVQHISRYWLFNLGIKLSKVRLINEQSFLEKLSGKGISDNLYPLRTLNKLNKVRIKKILFFRSIFILLVLTF
jgi:hypothetical protein